MGHNGMGEIAGQDARNEGGGEAYAHHVIHPVLTLGLLALFLFRGGSCEPSRSELVALPDVPRWPP